MCRACYAVVVAPEAEQQRLRRAAGLEVQVIQTTTAFEAATAVEPTPDVLIVHAASPLASASAGPAVVWIGEHAPDWADVQVPDDEALADALPGAVVRALIERRKR